MPETLNVLYLCTHNSARSIMAEVITTTLGHGRFRGYSAGSHAGTAPNALAIETLRRLSFPTDGLRSKNWEEFSAEGAPHMDFVITVCDDAAGEVCPVWPGTPVTGHWGVEDPSRFEGTDEDRLREFAQVAHILRRRIELLMSLPMEKLDRLRIQQSVREIGQQ